jgi:glycosyltransferase involved in cell wall biosynthesis
MSTGPSRGADLAVVILTHNEELHIARALDSVRAVATEVFVVDSSSSDRTVEIARRYGATVLQNRFVNYAKQFQWALDNAPLTSGWVMRLDADEVVSPALASEIAARLPALPSDVTGIVLKRKHIFMGRWIKHGGRYPLLLLRIWRRGVGRIEDRWMDEHMVLSHGRTVTFEGGFADHNLNDLTFFTEKHNKYATREAIDILSARLDLVQRDTGLTESHGLAQAGRKRTFKEKIYNRLPFQVGPLGYFLYRYVLQFGFLDGKPGLVYHFLQGFWYRFLVDAKVYELEQAIAGLQDRDAIVAELSRLTGHRIAGTADQPEPPAARTASA